MTPDADGLTNYRECSRPLGLANGEEIPIVGYGDLTVNFRTDHRWVRVKMNDVAHVPQLSHNLISLPSMTLKGHTYTGDKDGVTLKLKGGETVFFPLVGKLCRQYGLRPEAAGSTVDSACATIALGKTKAPTTPTDINILHCTFGHTHEVLLKKEQQGVNSSGELHECRGCSMARGLRKSIARSTHTGADTLCLSRAPAAAAPYCQRGGVYSGGGRERGGGVKSRRKEGARLGQRVQPRQRSGGVAPGVTRNARGASGRIRSRGSGGAEDDTPTPSASPGRGGASGGAEGDTPTPSAPLRRGGANGRIRSRGSGGAEDDTPTPSASPGRGVASGRIRSRGSGGAEGNPPTPLASPGREAPAAELGAEAAGVRKVTPQHHRPPPGGEAPAAELEAGAAGVRKATPRHHRPPSGGEAAAAEFAAAATGVRMATSRHQRFPPGGEAPAAKFAAAATGVRMATPRHQRFPPGGEAPAAKYVAAATGVRKVTPRHHRPPPGGPISVASTATVAATAARTAVPAATAAAATTVETFPPSRGDLRGTWRLLASSPHYRAATRGLSRGAWPWVRPARTTCWRTP